MKQHYIPEFVLRRWASSDGKLLRYTRPIDSKIVSRRVFPSQAGFERDLYSLAGGDLDAKYAVETEYFQTVDFEASKVIERILSDRCSSLSDLERVNWSRFVFSLFHRSPRSMKMWERKWRGTVYSDGSSPSASEAKELSKSNLPFFIDNERIVPFIAEMDWKLIHTDTCRFRLLMSDQPLTLTNGLMAENGHLALTISPKCIFLAIGPSSNALAQISKQPLEAIVRSMNRQTVERASFFVCADDAKQDRFIRNRFGSECLAPISSLFED